MNDLSNYISKQKKPKLIIVYDNMDRLPADKVKELWSSIHTFFSENGFPNIWVIIPFDEKHLSCAFGESNDISIVITLNLFRKALMNLQKLLKAIKGHPTKGISQRFP